MIKEKKKKHIGITHPFLIQEFHPTKNTISFEELTKGSGRPVWWRCDKGHEWMATPFDRTFHNRHCKICRELDVPHERSLGFLCPEVIEEWHPTANGQYTPFNILAYSQKKCVFCCSKCGHVWESEAKQRSKSMGCPRCIRKKLKENNRKLQLIERKNHIGLTHPQWVPFFDEEKNHPIRIEHLTVNSKRKVYWKCPYCEKHSVIDVQSLLKLERFRHCVHCEQKWLQKKEKINHIGLTHPEWVSFFDQEKNNPLTIEKITSNSNRELYWKCPHCQQSSLIKVRQLLKLKVHQCCRHCQKRWGHIPQNEPISNQTKRTRIPFKESSKHIGITHSEWIPFFDQDKNYPIRLEHLTSISNRLIHWRCTYCHHSFRMTPKKLIHYRVNQYCQCCGKRWNMDNFY